MTTIEYTFEWPAGPHEVIVTGEFDDWKGTLPLVKSTTGAFELTLPVKIPADQDKVFFKFIVDGEWVTSDAYNKGYDEQSGIENNYISDVEAKALSENPCEVKIPEAGGLPFVAAAATGAIKTEGPVGIEKAKEVTKTQEPAEPTPTRTSKEPLPGATPQVPIRTAIVGQEAKSSPANVVASDVTPTEASHSVDKDAEVEQVRFKIVRRVRKNTKTGQITVLSEEKIPLGPGESTPDGSIVHEELEHVDCEPTHAEENFHTLPVDVPQQTSYKAVAGEPGPVIPNNATDIKEFREVRNVDAKALNERLNAQVEANSSTLDPKSKIADPEELKPEPAVTPAVTEEVKKVEKVEKDPAPGSTPAIAPSTAPSTSNAAAATKTSKKAPSKTTSTGKTEEKKKKTGLLSKVKKIFQ